MDHLGARTDKPATFPVRVTPRASRDAIDGVDEAGRLRVRVTAAPADGAANRAVIKLLAGALHTPKSSVAIVAGATSRTKRLQVDGLDRDALRRRWPGLALNDQPAR